MSTDARLPLELLTSVLQSLRTGVIVFDAKQRVVLWNSWIEQHSQLLAQDVVGKPFTSLFPDMINGRTHIAIESALRKNLASLISQTLNKSPFPLYASLSEAANGVRMQQAVHVMPLNIPSLDRHCLVQISDVTLAVSREKKLREQTVELQSQTLVDGLTGIANRRRFNMHLEDEFRRAKRNRVPLSLIMIDVDYFKEYNDNYGHQQGDQCLVRLAAELSRIPHRATDLVARYGGEEFATILPDTDSDGALCIAQAMRSAVEALQLEHGYSKVSPYVTISLGISTLSPAQSAKSCELIHAADRSLYQAKHAGRNAVAICTNHDGPNQ